jgi:WD40 repeat protein
MKGRRIVTVFTLLMLLVFVGTIVFMIRKGGDEFTDPRKAIPVNAAVIIETKNLPGFIDQLESNSLWKEITSATGMQIAKSVSGQLDSLFKNNDLLAHLFSDKKSIISLQATARNKLDFLLIVHLSENDKEVEIEDQLRLGLASQPIATTSVIAGSKIYEFNFKASGSHITCAWSIVKRNLLIAINSQNIEDAIIRIDRRGPLNFPSGYVRIAGTAGANVLANMYVQYEFLSPLLTLCLPGCDASKLIGLSHFSKWGEYDISLKNDAVIMNGFTYAGDSLNTMANLFMSQNPSEMQATSIIPQGIAGFLHMGISDFNLYFLQFSALIKQAGRGSNFYRNLQEVNDSAGTNWVEYFSTILDGELGIIYMADNEKKYQIHYSRIKSDLFASQKLEEIITNYRRKASIKGMGIVTYRLNKDSVLKIYEMPVLYLGKTLLGPLFSGSEDRYCAFCNHYMIMANTPEMLAQLVDSVNDGEVLNNDISYHTISGNMETESNLTFFHNTAQFPGYFNDLFLPDSILAKDSSGISSPPSIQAIVYQVSRENGLIYNSLYIKHLPIQQSSDMLVWKTRLQAPVAFKPQIIINHNTKTKEILVQDSLNNLYLLSNSGSILWKIPLKERIIGDISQLDFYKNSKLQYFFSTTSALYLMDRRGKSVGKFPVQLSSAATSSATVVDYENDGKYRFAIPCKDKSIRIFDRNGKLISLWKSISESEVVQPIKYLRIGNKDYFVFADDRELRILNRKGENILKTKIQIPLSQNSIELSGQSGNQQLICTDTTGMVYYINFQGSKENKQLKHLSAHHYFDFEDVNGDGRKDFIFLDKRELEVYNSDGTKSFSYTFKSDISLPLIIANFSSSDHKIGIVSSSDSKIYLFNQNGSLQNGFPLEGRTAFSISNMKETNMYNLIVGGKENFLYNYLVQYSRP